MYGSSLCRRNVYLAQNALAATIEKPVIVCQSIACSCRDLPHHQYAKIPIRSFPYAVFPPIPRSANNKSTEEKKFQGTVAAKATQSPQAENRPGGTVFFYSSLVLSALRKQSFRLREIVDEVKVEDINAGQAPRGREAKGVETSIPAEVSRETTESTRGFDASQE